MPNLLDTVSDVIEEISEKNDKLTAKKEIIKSKVRVVKKSLDLHQILAEWKNKNIYDIFGIDTKSIKRFKSLNDEQKESIRAQFKALTRLFHPDKSPDSTEFFKLFTEAREILLDDTKKAKYDFDHNEIIFNREIPIQHAHYSAHPFSTFKSYTQPSSSTPPMDKSSDPEFDSMHSGGYAQPSFKQQKAKPITTEYAKWFNFISSEINEEQIKKFIDDNKNDINTLFAKEVDDKDNLYNPLRIAIEAKTNLNVKYLLRSGAQLNLSSYGLNKSYRTGLLCDLMLIIDLLSFSDSELIDILSNDEQLLNSVSHIRYIKLLKNATDETMEKLIVLLKKVKQNVLENVYRGLLVDCHFVGLSILVAAHPKIFNQLTRNYPFHELYYHYSDADKSYNSLFATLKILTQQGLILNDKNKPKEYSFTTHCVNFKSLVFFKALLNCGAIIDKEFLLNLTLRHDLNKVNDNPVLSYLKTASESYIQFQYFINEILSRLDKPNLNFVNLIRMISEEVQDCFNYYKLNCHDFHNIAACHILDRIYSRMKNELNACDKVEAALLEKIINLYPHLSLAYGFEHNIKPVPALFRAAKFIMLDRVSAGIYQKDDYFVCYDEEGKYLIVYYDGAKVRGVSIHNSLINRIEELQLKNHIEVPVEKLFELKYPDKCTILHLNAQDQPSGGNNMPLLKLLNYPRLVKPIINNLNSDNATVMHYAARYDMNGELCKQLVELGARIDIEGNVYGDRIKVNQYKGKYIAELIQLAHEYDTEHQQELEEYELQKQGLNLLRPIIKK